MILAYSFMSVFNRKIGLKGIVSLPGFGIDTIQALSIPGENELEEIAAETTGKRAGANIICRCL